MSIAFIDFLWNFNHMHVAASDRQRRTKPPSGEREDLAIIRGRRHARAIRQSVRVRDCNVYFVIRAAPHFYLPGAQIVLRLDSPILNPNSPSPERQVRPPTGSSLQRL